MRCQEWVGKAYAIAEKYQVVVKISQARGWDISMVWGDGRSGSTLIASLCFQEVSFYDQARLPV